MSKGYTKYMNVMYVYSCVRAPGYVYEFIRKTIIYVNHYQLKVCRPMRVIEHVLQSLLIIAII